jgi:glycopeptide antibiotics resistance protein
LGLSAVSELLQLVGHRGLFELDDLFHNTVGTALGCLAFLLVWRLTQRINPRRAEKKR